MNPELLTTIKFSISALILIYLIRNTFKFRQMIMFVENFRKVSNQYRPDPFPLTHSTTEELEDIEQVPEKVKFAIPIEELINGFGFNFTPESFASIINTPTFTLNFYALIAFHILIANLLCYFFFGIPLSLLVFITSGIVFLLAII